MGTQFTKWTNRIWQLWRVTSILDLQRYGIQNYYCWSDAEYCEPECVARVCLAPVKNVENPFFFCCCWCCWYYVFFSFNLYMCCVVWLSAATVDCLPPPYLMHHGLRPSARLIIVNCWEIIYTNFLDMFGLQSLILSGEVNLILIWQKKLFQLQHEQLQFEEITC